MFFSQVYKKMGFTDKDLDEHFGGPAFLAWYVNSIPATGNFCHLRITFANSLDPDQARLSVGPDQDLKGLTLWWYS